MALPDSGPRARSWPIGAAAVAWLAGEVGGAAPAVPWRSVLAGACVVLAWALVAAVAAVSASGLSGREWAGWPALVGVVALGGWLHRLPEWLAPGLRDRYLAWPPAGVIGRAYFDWDAPAVIWWRTCHVATDVLIIVLLAVVVRRPVARSLSPRTQSPPPGPVAGAVAVAVVVAAVVASLTGLRDGGAATPQAAQSFLVANGVSVLAAGMLGVLALGHRGVGRPVGALTAGLVLDAVAGLLGDRTPWAGPLRLGAPPSDTDWQLAPAGTILAMAAAAAAGCLTFLAVPVVARGLQRLQDRPRAALLLGLIANTVDALATHVGLNTGSVVEGNPVVRVTGVAGKWVAVTLLLVLLHRLRPRAVWIATTAYLLVVAYHVLGMALLAG